MHREQAIVKTVLISEGNYENEYPQHNLFLLLFYLFIHLFNYLF